MKYLSTKEIAERWQISPRRVSVLAADGRIAGVRQIDGRWFIPEDAEKPTDARISQAKRESNKPDSYFFPFLPGTVCSEEQIDRFSPDKKSLYRACMLYEEGNFSEARSDAEALLSSPDPYVRIGALYLLPFTCLYLFDYISLEKYAILFRTGIINSTDHRAELDLLLAEFDSEFVSLTAFTSVFDHLDIHDFGDDLMPYIALTKLSSDVSVCCETGVFPDLLAYEVICRTAEKQGYFYIEVYLHYLLSLFYAAVGDEKKEYAHTKSAVKIVTDRGMYFSLAYNITYNPETLNKVLAEYPPEIGEKIRKFGRLFQDARTGYSCYLGISTALTHLRDEDYKLISYCLRDYSIEQLSDIFCLSESGMKKRLSALYSKLGVRSKHEMSRVFFKSVLDWGKN